MEDGSDNSLQDKLIEFGKKNLIVLALFAGGLILISTGLIQIFGQRETSIKFEGGAEVAGSNVSKIKVDVDGEVINPGVYELASDARVQDALIAAGGLTQNANRRAINLAAKIADGQKIYVPGEGEAVTSTTGITPSTSSGQAGITGVVSINSATQADLEELPGVGPVTAGKIIDGRPYGSIEELLERKVVGKAAFEKIKDQISL